MNSTTMPVKLSIDSLPDQLIVRIFEFLIAPERIRLERVCRKWNYLSQQSWSKCHSIGDDFCLYKRRIDKEKNNSKSIPILSAQERSELLKKVLSRCGKYVKSVHLIENMSSASLLIISRFCPNMEKIQISNVMWKFSLNSLALHCHHLQLIKFDFCFSKRNVDDELGILFRNCVHLRSLDLVYAKITGRCLVNLPVEMSSIRFVLCESLENEEFRTLSDRCSQLELLKLMQCDQITLESLLYALPKLKALRTLHLHSYPTSNGPQLSMALSVLNHLTKLDLTYSDWVNDETLAIISRSFLSLRKLNISCCDNVTYTGITHLSRMQRLTNLDVSFCKNVTNESIKAVAKFGRLEVLKCKDYYNMNDELVMELVEFCLNLTKLVLSGAVKITDRSVKMLANLIHLKVLDLRMCKNLTNASVCVLAKYCSNLSKLNLSRTKITDNEVKSLAKLAGLEILDISYNKNITDYAVMELAKCKKLKILNLSSCTKITVASILSFLDHIDDKSVLLSLIVYDTSVIIKPEDFKNVAIANQLVHLYCGTVTWRVYVHPLLKVVLSPTKAQINQNQSGHRSQNFSVILSCCVIVVTGFVCLTLFKKNR